MSNETQNINQTDLASAFVSDNTTPTEPSVSVKPKSHKGLIVFLSILSVLAIATAVTFACLYFLNNNPTNQNNSTSSTATETETEQETTTKVPDEEVAITDTYVLRDLDEKIALLHLTNDTENSFTKEGFGLHPENPLYLDGNLSESAKLMHTIFALQDKFRYLDENESTSAFNQVVSEELRTSTKNTISTGIDFQYVSEKYKDAFGEDLTLQDRYKYCPYFHYNKEFNFFFDYGGCGGATSVVNHFYKFAFTASNDNAYVYIAAASTAPEQDENVSNNTIIYCDITTSTDNNPQICGTLPYTEANNFTLNESNYQDFAKYRFVFNKADDGTYYFSHVEKLSD